MHTSVSGSEASREKLQVPLAEFASLLIFKTQVKRGPRKKSAILFYFIVLYVLVAQSCLTLCDPMDCSPPGFSVREVLQTRILEWIAMLSFTPKKPGGPGVVPSRISFQTLLINSSAPMTAQGSSPMAAKRW